MTTLIIPRPGESINEVVVSKWFVKNGDFVEKDQEVGEIESDKATLPLIAPVSGKIAIAIEVGTTVNVGTVACNIDESAAAPPKVVSGAEPKAITPQKAPLQSDMKTPVAEKIVKQDEAATSHVKVSPVARKIMDENNLSVDDIISGLRRIGKEEVEMVVGMQALAGSIKQPTGGKAVGSRTEKREAMTQLRKKLSKRLVAVKNETAMLTTFNEIDMSEIMALRSKFQKSFTDKHGLKLGFMSVFSKAAAIALTNFPKVNSQIDGDDIIVPSYVDIAIAVQTDKGLMVPVVRSTESLSVADIEKEIARLAEKARAGRLSIEEMSGGTFTITNGGVFGSLLSTPIINPPQSAILGMHNIVERPVAINGKVEIRPMMYVALSYDHRIIDGKDSVSFLVNVKELIESPLKLLFDVKSPEKLLFGL